MGEAEIHVYRAIDTVTTGFAGQNLIFFTSQSLQEEPMSSDNTGTQLGLFAKWLLPANSVF